jgi:hypothetical protein
MESQMQRSIFDRLDNSSVRHSIARLADDAPVPHTDSIKSQMLAREHAVTMPADSWVGAKPPRFTMAQACTALAAQAASTARDTIKVRARVYALKPRQLEAIAEGMSRLPPRALVTALQQIDAIAKMRGTRWFGQGGEIPAINFRGAMWYARHSRAKQRQLAARDA